MNFEYIGDFLKKYKFCLLIIMLVLIGIWIITGPKTVASGNGYAHQIGEFGECDMDFDGCEISATHRRHHFLGNEDYCESCWAGYGKNMFDKLSETRSDSSDLENNEYKCRHAGCGGKAKYTDWTRRYCSEHINGTHYCRYPGCLNEISNYNSDLYCHEH